METENNKTYRRSVDSTDSSSGSAVVLRSKPKIYNLWRSRSSSSFTGKKNGSSVLESIPSQENLDTKSNATIVSSKAKPHHDMAKWTSEHFGRYDQFYDMATSHDIIFFDNMPAIMCGADKTEIKDIKDTKVTVVLVEARGLPDPPDDSSTHGLYCKLRLGSKTATSKMVSNTQQPKWKERFDLQLSKDHLLRISVWDKGKQKNFMGSCVIDLAELDKDRTHEIWQQLDDGYGLVHISVTMYNMRNNVTPYSSVQDKDDAREKYALHNFRNLCKDWKTVGQLHLKVIGAKGLNGKASAYCTLELDNQRVLTHSVRASSEPTWEKSYVFHIYDISSTLDIKVYDSSVVNPIRSESLGRVSIPLLRIPDKTLRWYALKDRTKRHSAKGNCPRVLLEMSIYWNPVKAAARLFQPQEVKYIKKPPKFDPALIHSNLEFVRDLYASLQDVNEAYKHLFEWDNRELSFVAVVLWVVFWYYFRFWTTPLLMLIPFVYYWAQPRNQNERSPRQIYNATEDNKSELSEPEKDDKNITLGKIQGLPEMTLKITSSVEYMVSFSERINNLISFKVPFLSYLAMLFLILASAALYFIPINYFMIALGIYKFTRKYLNPNRTPNNDFLDFIARVPDNEILKDWKELSVPEPIQRRPSVSKKTPLAKSLSVS